MISVIYTIAAVLLIIYLSFKVINLRRARRISVGDGNNQDLEFARGAQSNAIEYIPIALLLLYALEFNGAANWIIHLSGISLLVGRLIHAHGMLGKHMKYRVLGMQITVFTLLGLCILNLIFLPYNELLTLL